MLVPIADRSQVAGARRSVVEVAASQGLDENSRARAGLVATELATNVLKHAREGALVVSAFDDAEGVGVEILALDKGAGIADVQRALSDGMSTAGTRGHGLGSIKRQSDEFAIYSLPNCGTAIVARICRAGSAKAAAATIGAVAEAYPGETISGDDWAHATGSDRWSLFLADGTGHGPLAASAADLAKKVFLEYSARDSLMIAQLIHRALAPTRGAAIAVARASATEKTVRFVGVGNIAAAVVSGAGIKRMVSNHGTAGHIAPRIREFSYAFEPGALIILHSDGLSAKWDMASYPGLASAHPSLVAGVLFRDHRRGRDDATVVAMRVAP